MKVLLLPTNSTCGDGEGDDWILGWYSEKLELEWFAFMYKSAHVPEMACVPQVADPSVSTEINSVAYDIKKA